MACDAAKISSGETLRIASQQCAAEIEKSKGDIGTGRGTAGGGKTEAGRVVAGNNGDRRRSEAMSEMRERVDGKHPGVWSNRRGKRGNAVSICTVDRESVSMGMDGMMRKKSKAREREGRSMSGDEKSGKEAKKRVEKGEKGRPRKEKDGEK